MKTKLVLWGSNAKDEKILIALQLRAEDNKVDTWTFPDTVATDEFARQLLGEWRNGGNVDFPEETVYSEKDLSVTDTLLPDDIKTERGDVIQRAQTEWHFVVLSNKLNEVYKVELGELREEVEKQTAFGNEMWDKLRGFWDKVQEQVQERNLLKEHADLLRDGANELFGKLKSLRNALDEDFRQSSKETCDKFIGRLEELEKQAAEGMRLPAIFDELKNLQRKFKDLKLTREHRSKIWERLDATFKNVKERRFGSNSEGDGSALERLSRRFTGLLSAIDKMQKSISYDEDDLRYQQKKIDNTDGQLEAQIRQAKMKMTQERIVSKKEKLNEMLQTKTELDKRIASQKDKDNKRKKYDDIAAAKQTAKEKIALEIATAAKARVEDEDKLHKLAETIVKPTTVEEDSPTTVSVQEEVLPTSVVEEVVEAPVVEEVVETPVEEEVVETPVEEEVVETPVEEEVVETPVEEEVVETPVEEEVVETPVEEEIVDDMVEITEENALDSIIDDAVEVSEIVSETSGEQH